MNYLIENYKIIWSYLKEIAFPSTNKDGLVYLYNNGTKICIVTILKPTGNFCENISYIPMTPQEYIDTLGNKND